MPEPSPRSALVFDASPDSVPRNAARSGGQRYYEATGMTLARQEALPRQVGAIIVAWRD